MKLAVISLALTLVAVGCKTSPPDGSIIVDGTSMPGDLNPSDHDDIAKVPLTLWSPGQRRAMAGYYYLVGEMTALQERDSRKSLPVFEAAYGLDPTPFLGAKMIAAKAQAGQKDEAILEVRMMVLLFPQDPHLRYLFGQLLALSGYFEEAAEQLESCVDLDPRFEACYQEILDIHQQAREFSKAIVVAKEMTKNLPNSVTAWTVLSRIYLVQGDHSKALDPAARAYEMQSSNPHLIQVYALALQLNGQSKRAIWLYEKLFRMDPTDETVMTRMVELYREIGNLKDALGLVDQLIAEAPENHALRVQKAILLWELEEFKDASILLDALSQEFPESERLLYMAGLGQERLKDLERALKTYASIPESSPFFYQGGLRRVVIHKGLKQFDEGIALGNALKESVSVEWDLFGLVAGVMADAEQYKSAVELLAEGFARFPDQTRLLFLKGVYQEKAGDIEACIATMREVIAKDAENSSAYNYLGYLYADRAENLDEAEELVKKALEIKPGDGFYLDSLGWVYYQKGEYDKALPLLLEAAKAQPKEGVIYEHLGDLKKITKKVTEAIAFYEKALSVDLEEKDRKRVVQKLEELTQNAKRAQNQP